MNYRINSPRVVHETLDEETIVIDFETGAYYTLTGVGHWILSLLNQHQTVAQIVDQITARYSGEQEEIDEAVRQFIGNLAAASIIVKVATPVPAVALSLPFTPKTPFTPPLLEEFTDIQDLLLLDPIHEVSKQGWPMRKV
jgi:hypothetical protein